MKDFEIVGMNCYGNTELLTKPQPRIGVFASRSGEEVVDTIREQWAIAKGRAKKCIVGTFHSRAECEILYLVLKYGGSAVWLTGCSLPDKLPSFAKKYIRRKKLLIVSCFHREHHNIHTARYCAQVAAMVSSYLVFFSLREKSLLMQIYNKAIAQGKWIESF